MERGKKRVQTLPKPAALPLAGADIARKEEVEELNLESIQLRSIRTKFELMEDMRVFDFAMSL